LRAVATLVHPPALSLPLHAFDRVTCRAADDRSAEGALEHAVSRAHRATAALLVERSEHVPEAPLRQLLVAVEDGPAALGLVRFASALAADSGGYVQLVHVRGAGYGPATRHRLAELSLEIIAITAAEPIVDVLHAGQIATGIVELARRCESSLLVVGRTRPAAARSLGPVGEALVRRAPCSVLVVPAAATS